MAHVLNAHHCELDEDLFSSYDSEFGGLTSWHFKEKENDPSEVRPGRGGKPWGEASADHEQMHTYYSCDSVQSSSALYTARAYGCFGKKNKRKGLLDWKDSEE